MQLSKQAIREFKSIYKEEFREDISDYEAYELAANLLRLFKIIYRPIPKEKKKEEKKAVGVSKS